MDIIIERAKKFCSLYLVFRAHRYSKYQDFISRVTTEVSEIDSRLDKIKFLTVVMEENNSQHQAHKKDCTNPGKCPLDFLYENINYCLIQELARLDVVLNDDTFTNDEKHRTESKLDQILKELNDLKLGHEIIYDDLMNEINELRTLFFLGKKKWYQLLVGKAADMVASGVVSETVSKKIIHGVKDAWTTLLTQ